MEYLKRENDKLIKYEVTYNKKALELLLFKIIKKCGVREHKCIYTDYPNRDDLLDENFKMTPVGEKEYDVEIRTIYKVEYDHIYEPELAILISKLIESNNLAILEYIYGDKKLKNSYLKYKDDLVQERKDIKNRLKIMLDNKLDYHEATKLLERLKELDAIEKMNNEIKLEDQIDYFEEVKSKIKLEKIDEIDYDTYNKVMNFTKKRVLK